jgi:hypothetical protein
MASLHQQQQYERLVVLKEVFGNNLIAVTVSLILILFGLIFVDGIPFQYIFLIILFLLVALLNRCGYRFYEDRQNYYMLSVLDYCVCLNIEDGTQE